MTLLLLPILGAFIGWSTNLLAIHMLFHPRRPVRVPLLGLTVQGLLPRRRRELAAAVGTVVGEQLLAPELLAARIFHPRLREEITAHVMASVRQRVGASLPGLLPRPLAAMAGDFLADAARREVERFFGESLVQVLEKVKGDLNLAGVVEERLNSLSLEELEALLLRLARTEVRHIELLGGVIGFFIGLIQAAVALLHR